MLKRRVEFSRLQNEQNVRLRSLEDALLAEISRSDSSDGRMVESDGGAMSLLEDDAILDALERLKREAAEANDKIARSSATLAEVAEVAALYSPLAQACAKSYVVLEELGEVQPLYRSFSIQFLLRLLTHALVLHCSRFPRN